MLVRANFSDLSLLDALPAIDEVIHNKYKQRAPQWKEFFRALQSTREMEQTTGFSGVGNLVKVAEGKPTQYDDPVQGFRKTFIHDQWTLGIRMSRVMMDDDRFGLMKSMAASLGRSARETQEIVHANYVNLNPVGPDGVPLFATNHPIYKKGGVQSNRIGVTSDVDVVSLELALTGMRKWRSPEGHRVRLSPAKVVVHPDQEWRAIELLSGTMRSDTADHVVNAFRNRSDGEGRFTKYKVWDYLEDPLKWYIWADLEDTEMRSYAREAPNTIHDVDFDSRSIKTAIWMRFSYGHSDAAGVWGCF